jgi:type I restriction enzyme S subunit
MEAAYHDPAAEEIENRIVNGKYDLVNDLCKEVSLPGIFKRIFIDDINYGALYYSGSAMFWLEPLHKEILSRNTTLFDDVLLTKGTILIQAFGQKGGLIGRVAWAGKFLDGACTTHMLVRVIPKDDKYSGYLFAYLSSDVGYAQIIRLPFGGSIPHFTEKDIARLPVPLMAEEQVEEINNNTLIALAYRDEALECEQEARRLVGTAIREGSL